jgi:uncharacterized protein
MEQRIDKHKFGPWAIVTGASSGIGREFARQIAWNGMHLVLVARRLRLLEEARAYFEKTYGIQCRIVQADLSKDGFLDKIELATKDLDIGLVVSNAGTASPGEFLKHDRSSILDLFKLNAQAHLELCHYFGKRLAERKRGGLLLVGAMGAARGVPYLAHESASKSFRSNPGRSLEFRVLSARDTCNRASRWAYADGNYREVRPRPQIHAYEADAAR